MSNTAALELKSFNPVGLQLLRYVGDESIRRIICYGGSSSGKSYSVAQVLLMMSCLGKDNSLVMRKVGSSIFKSIYEDFRQAAIQLKIADRFTFRNSVRRIINDRTGARIDFSGLDDPEKIKGISNYRWVFLDEWSEYDEADDKQIRKRLRGKRGQQIITAFNPIKETHWIKQNVIDREKWHDVPMEFRFNGIRIDPRLTEVKSIKINSPKSILNPRTQEFEEHAPDTVLIQSTYLNNFWVVGSPDGTYGYYDEQCIADFEKDRLHDPDYYGVYALGEWGVIRTGSEYFGSFNRARNCRAVEYDPTLPIHLSLDNNVLPYISVSWWQVDYSDGIEARQIRETCAANPHNSATKSAELVGGQLKEMGYSDRVYIHGDCTTRNANTVDDNKRSFLDKFMQVLVSMGFDVVDMVGRTNPSVQMSGEFINQIFEGIEGLSIVIGDNCTTSIDDYLSVQKDANGGIYKRKVKDSLTGQAYEEHGHLSDCMRYLICDVMHTQFIDFSNRRKYNMFARDGYLHFYNPDTECNYSAELVYCMPNIGGKFVMVHGKKCGDKWHITDVGFIETESSEHVKERLIAVGCPMTVIECGKSYYPFVRDLRASCQLEIRTVPETGDIDRRISATSDFVRSSVLFNGRKASTDEEYGAFMESLLDYNRDSRNKHASAALSGFVKISVKLFSD